MFTPAGGHHNTPFSSSSGKPAAPVLLSFVCDTRKSSCTFQFNCLSNNYYIDYVGWAVPYDPAHSHVISARRDLISASLSSGWYSSTRTHLHENVNIWKQSLFNIPLTCPHDEAQSDSWGCKHPVTIIFVSASFPLLVHVTSLARWREEEVVILAVLYANVTLHGHIVPFRCTLREMNELLKDDDEYIHKWSQAWDVMTITELVNELKLQCSVKCSSVFCIHTRFRRRDDKCRYQNEVFWLEMT